MAGYISDGTTNLSNLSLSGSVGLLTSRISSTGSLVVNELWASTVSTPSLAASTISSGGNSIVGFSKLSVKIPVSVVQGSASTFTVGIWAGLVLGDVIVTSVAADDGLASSISSGLVAHSHCTISGRYEFRYSNVSTLVQNQSAKSFNLVAFRPF